MSTSQVMGLPSAHVYALAEGGRRRSGIGHLLRRLVLAVEPGYPVSPSVLVSSRPWAPPLLLLVLLGLLVAIAPGGSVLEPVGRWWAEHSPDEAVRAFPVGTGEVVAILAGFVVLFGVSSWSWPVRLAALLVTWAFASYELGLLSWVSWEGTQDAIAWLASQPGVDVFPPPPPGSVDALVVVIFALVLTPFVVGLVLFVIWAWSAFVAEILRPLAFGRALPDWMLMVPVLTGLTGLAYVSNAVWLPWCLWVLGVVARAVVIMKG